MRREGDGGPERIRTSDKRFRNSRTPVHSRVAACALAWRYSPSHPASCPHACYQCSQTCTPGWVSRWVSGRYQGEGIAGRSLAPASFIWCNVGMAASDNPLCMRVDSSKHAFAVVDDCGIINQVGRCFYPPLAPDRCIHASGTTPSLARTTTCYPRRPSPLAYTIGPPLAAYAHRTDPQPVYPSEMAISLANRPPLRRHALRIPLHPAPPCWVKIKTTSQPARLMRPCAMPYRVAPAHCRAGFPILTAGAHLPRA